jgi:hypothetical protein
MDLTRRDLLRSGLAAGAVGTLGRTATPSYAASKPTGRGTRWT